MCGLCGQLLPEAGRYFLRNDVCRRTGLEVHDVINGRVDDALHGFLRVEGGVRRHNDARMVDEVAVLKHNLQLVGVRVRCGEERRPFAQISLLFKHIKCGAGEYA